MTAQEIFDHYTSQIRQAASPEKQAKAKAAWDAAYDELSSVDKIEIKRILKERANRLLEKQTVLDECLEAVGLGSPLSLDFQQIEPSSKSTGLRNDSQLRGK